MKQLREQKAQAQEDAADAISKANQKADELQHETQRAFRFKQERDDLQSQLEQLRTERDFWRTRATEASKAAEKWYHERY